MYWHWPTKPTAAHEIISNAISSATMDPRFEPVGLDELDELECSVDILSPEPIKESVNLILNVTGLSSAGGQERCAPSDIEGVDSAVEQVNIAKQKAGISPRGLRTGEVWGSRYIRLEYLWILR